MARLREAPAQNSLAADANDYFNCAEVAPRPGSSLGPSAFSCLESDSRSSMSSKTKSLKCGDAAGCELGSEAAWPTPWPELPYSEDLQGQTVLGYAFRNRGLQEQVYWAPSTNFGNLQPARTSGAQTSLKQAALLPARIPSRTPSPVLRWEVHQPLPLCLGSANDVLGYDNKRQEIGVENGDVLATAEHQSHSIPQMQMQSLSSSPRPFVIIKNTFLHYTSDEENIGKQGKLERCNSAPGALGSSALIGHDSSLCRPCAFFFGKEDGCRNGVDCKFCHLCPPGMIKQKKKEKLERLRASRGGNQSIQ